MATIFEVSNEGKTLQVFDRCGTFLKGGEWQIDDPLGSTIVDHDLRVQKWIIGHLARCNGNVDQHFVWVNPQVMRMLFFAGIITPEHVEAAEQRRLKDWSDFEECFVCRDVTFDIGGKFVNLTVVVSSRNINSQMSWVTGSIPDKGTIMLKEMSKINKCSDPI